MVVTEPTTPSRPLGQSGYGGLLMKGIQLGSPTVRGLPSVAAIWMAVTGRHHMYWSFAFQMVPALSAMVVVNSGEQTRAVGDVQAAIGGQLPQPALDPHDARIREEERGLGLRVGAHGAVGLAVGHHLVELLEVGG